VEGAVKKKLIEVAPPLDAIKKWLLTSKYQSVM